MCVCVCLKSYSHSSGISVSVKHLDYVTGLFPDQVQVKIHQDFILSVRREEIKNLWFVQFYFYE